MFASYFLNLRRFKSRKNIGAIIALGCCLTFDGVIMFQSSLLSFNRPAVYAVMTAEGGFGLLVTLIIWVSGRMRD